MKEIDDEEKDYLDYEPLELTEEDLEKLKKDKLYK